VERPQGARLLGVQTLRRAPAALCPKCDSQCKRGQPEIHGRRVSGLDGRRCGAASADRTFYGWQGRMHSSSSSQTRLPMSPCWHPAGRHRHYASGGLPAYNQGNPVAEASRENFSLQFQSSSFPPCCCVLKDVSSCLWLGSSACALKLVHGLSRDATAMSRVGTMFNQCLRTPCMRLGLSLLYCGISLEKGEAGPWFDQPTQLPLLLL